MPASSNVLLLTLSAFKVGLSVWGSSNLLAPLNGCFISKLPHITYCRATGHFAHFEKDFVWPFESELSSLALFLLFKSTMVSLVLPFWGKF